MKRVAILDGSQRSALAVTRALGKAGFSVHAGDSSNGISSASRWAKYSFTYSNPAVHASLAFDEICEYVLRHKIDLVFPISDITIHLLLSRGADKAGITLACAPLCTYLDASDKGILVEIAKRSGLSAPKTERIESETPLESLPNGFSFPVVLKPTLSRIATECGYTHTAVAVAHDLNDFIAIQRKDSWFTEHPWLLQTYIEGTGQGVFSLYDHGRPVAWFAHERIREKPPTGGVSVLSRSALLSPQLKEAAKTLLDALQWHGPVMVEFRVAADGTPYLMEINARFWGSLQLAIAAGINFPVLAAQIAMGEHPKQVENYRVGVYNRWLLGDLDNLYLTLKAQRRDFRFSQKLATFGKFMIPWWPGLHYEINQWGDMGPFWHELKHYLR